MASLIKRKESKNYFVQWRIGGKLKRRSFHRLFNNVYVEAFETILFLEKVFGAQLRDYVVRISKERWSLRSEAKRIGFESATGISQK